MCPGKTKSTMLPGSNLQSSRENEPVSKQIKDITGWKAVYDNPQNKCEMFSMVEWSLPPTEIKEIFWKLSCGRWALKNHDDLEMDCEGSYDRKWEEKSRKKEWQDERMEENQEHGKLNWFGISQRCRQWLQKKDLKCSLKLDRTGVRPSH